MQRRMGRAMSPVIWRLVGVLVHIVLVLLHEIAVQAATTPENLVIGGGIIVGAGGAEYYGLSDD